MDLLLAIVGCLLVLFATQAGLGLLQRHSSTVRQLIAPLRTMSLAVAVASANAFLLPQTTQSLFERFDLGTESLVWTISGALFAIGLIHLGAIYLFDVILSQRRGYLASGLVSRVGVALMYLGVGLGALAAFGVPLSGLLATSAITSLILGLALQPVLGNFFAGLVLTFERPYRINDWIKWQGTEARVVEITWRTTHLRNRDNDDIVVPNSAMAATELVNFYYPNTMHLERVYVRVHYKTPPYRATEALLDAAKRTAGVLDNPSPDVFLVDFEDYGARYELRIWIANIADRPWVENAARRNIWEVFRQRGIQIPMPIQTIEIDETHNSIRHLDEAPAETTAKTGWLYVEVGPNQGTTIRLLDQPITIGRGTDCNLMIAEPRASKQHLRIELQNESFVLQDLDSHNGTFVDGRKIERHVLKSFERIHLGDTVIIFEQQ